jgi:hypothetical protein
MKLFHPLLLIVLLLAFVSCDNSETPNLSVERYVELLKEGKYESSELPDFSSKDIPKLLAYRNETVSISGFPVNYISSSITPECTLGMFVLWTVESIRARSAKSEFLVGTFPSQNPVVRNRENLEFPDQSSQVQKVVADSYFVWWENNKNNDFAKFSGIDPLADTDFRWH